MRRRGILGVVAVLFTALIILAVTAYGATPTSAPTATIAGNADHGMRIAGSNWFGAPTEPYSRSWCNTQLGTMQRPLPACSVLALAFGFPLAQA